MKSLMLYNKCDRIAFRAFIMSFNSKNLLTRIKNFFDIHPSVYKVSFVSFFIQFGSTLIHTTGNHFLINDLKLLNENEFVLLKITSETVSTFCKVIAGYLSDLFRNRKNFLILGYSSVVCFKICFSVCTLTWLLPFWFCRNFFIAAQFTDRIFNSIRDGAKDAYALDASSQKQAPSAFAIRKMLSSFGTVFGGIAAFISISYFNVTATQMYTFSIIPTGIAAIMSFALIKDVIVNKKSENKSRYIYMVITIISLLCSIFGCFYSFNFAFFLLPIITIYMTIRAIIGISNSFIYNQYILFMLFVVWALSFISYFFYIPYLCTIASVVLISFYYFSILENTQKEESQKRHISSILIPLFSLILCLLFQYFPNLLNNRFLLETNGYLKICKYLFFAILALIMIVPRLTQWTIIRNMFKTLLLVFVCGSLSLSVCYLSLFSFNQYLFTIMFTMFLVICSLREKFFTNEIFKTVSDSHKMSKFLLLVPLIIFVFCSKVNENMYWIGAKSATITEKHFPLLFALSYLFIAIFSAIYGVLLRNKRVVLALFITFFSMILANMLAIKPSLVKTILTMICFGCSAAGIDVGISYIISQSIPSDKTRATVLGLFYTISGFFNFIAGMAMCSLKSQYGIKYVFAVSGGFAILAMLYLLIFQRSIRSICDK